MKYEKYRIYENSTGDDIIALEMERDDAIAKLNELEHCIKYGNAHGNEYLPINSIRWLREYFNTSAVLSITLGKYLVKLSKEMCYKIKKPWEKPSETDFNSRVYQYHTDVIEKLRKQLEDNPNMFAVYRNRRSKENISHDNISSNNIIPFAL